MRCSPIDNYLRRRAHQEGGTDSLTPILGYAARAADAWKEISGKEIGVTEGDLTDWPLASGCSRTSSPRRIVHYGQSRRRRSR